jgi:hypothetical protein
MDDLEVKSKLIELENRIIAIQHSRLDKVLLNKEEYFSILRNKDIEEEKIQQSKEIIKSINRLKSAITFIPIWITCIAIVIVLINYLSPTFFYS